MVAGLCWSNRTSFINLPNVLLLLFTTCSGVFVYVPTLIVVSMRNYTMLSIHFHYSKCWLYLYSTHYPMIVSTESS